RSCNLPFSAASPAAPSLSETHTYPMISTSVILPDHYILLSLPFLTPKYAIVRISVSQGTFLVKKICVNSVCDSVRSAQSPRVQKERSPALFALPESALFSAFLFLLF